MLTLACTSALDTLIWDNGKIVENLPCAGMPCEKPSGSSNSSSLYSYFHTISLSTVGKLKVVTMK